MTSPTLDEALKRIGWSHEPSKIEGKRDWYDAYGELIGTFDAHEGWDEVRRYLMDRVDADYDSETGFIPNREMRLVSEMDFQ